MHNSEKHTERNPDPSNIANLFQKNDFEGICFHADLNRDYNNNIFDKILLSSIKTNNSALFIACKEIIDQKKWDWWLKKGNGEFKEKWINYFLQYKGLLESNIVTNVGENEKRFREDGTLWMEGVFVNGELNGLGRVYDRKGKIFEEGSFKDGMLNGIGKMFLDGIILKEGEFLEGQLNGLGKQYLHGNLIYEGEFMFGEYSYGKEYWPNGSLKYDEGSFFEGEYFGYGKEFREDGTLCNEGFFDDGELNGEGKKYHKNGKLWKEGEFLNGKLNGIGSVYRDDGTLRYEGEFIDGELVENFNEQNEDDATESSSRENDLPKINKTKDLSKEKDKDIQRESARKIKEKQKELEKIEKERERSFRIKYSIKLKKEISSQNMTGSILGTLLGYDKLKHVKSVQNEKGENIVRFIDIFHKGDKLPINIAKHYVQEKDTDVKNGRAGSSTIVIIEIKP